MPPACPVSLQHAPTPSLQPLGRTCATAGLAMPMTCPANMQHAPPPSLQTLSLSCATAGEWCHATMQPHTLRSTRAVVHHQGEMPAMPRLCLSGPLRTARAWPRYIAYQAFPRGPAKLTPSVHGQVRRVWVQLGPVLLVSRCLHHVFPS